ncbi:MAG: glycerol-3-phosphate acyltransferase [Acidimicrobiia bacterium]
MIILAGITGYLLGSAPTAAALGRLWRVDLRAQGSKNPGANNALRLGGPVLAALVLLIEAGKGAVAVLAGAALAGAGGATLAGVLAAAGNVYNVWYRFSGGKGLGITGGILLALWPTVLPALLALLVVVVIATRSSGVATLTALGGLVGAGVLWARLDFPVAWGFASDAELMAAALGLAAVLIPKHWRDARFRTPDRP